MMLDFLNSYHRSISLDSDRYKDTFNEGVKKADFLLFENSIICEFKDLLTIDVKNRIEKIGKKEIKSQQDFKRDLYGSIEKSLSHANKQIKRTREILNLPFALGLAIIENHIPDDISVMALIDAADRKMMTGLDGVDGVLCLDFVNAFVDGDGNYIQPAQIVVRDGERGSSLYQQIGVLLKDFSINRNTVLHTNQEIVKADQKWYVKTDGKYSGYSVSINLNTNDR